MDSYKILNKDAFLEMLNVSENDLKKIIKEKSSCYHNFLIRNKKHDSLRLISAIKNKSDIFVLQKTLQKEFFSSIYFPSNVYGFIKQRNYLDYLEPHCSKNNGKFFIRLDIKSFFDTISSDIIKECLSYYINEACDDKEKSYIVDSIIEIVTLDNKLIQGAVTSPVISNLVFRRIDIRIERFCEKNNITYTRYADDMLFSGFDDFVHKRSFINMIVSIIKDYGFSLNYKKTLRMRDELSINGYVVGEEIRLSRKKFEVVNYILFYLNGRKKGGCMSRIFKYKLINILAGYRALFIQVMKNTYDEKNKATLKRKISKIEKGIDKLLKIEEGWDGVNRLHENKVLLGIYQRK